MTTEQDYQKRIAELEDELKRVKRSNAELFQKFKENLLKKVKSNESYKTYKYIEGVLNGR